MNETQWRPLPLIGARWVSGTWLGAVRRIDGRQAGHLTVVSLLLTVLVIATGASSAGMAANQPSPANAAQRIEYRMPEAGDVVLVWWLSDAVELPSSLLPEGTRQIDGVLHTPMQRKQGLFSTTIPVPPGTKPRHGFLITSTRDGRPAELWVTEPYRGVGLAAAAALPVLLLSLLHWGRRGQARVTDSDIAFPQGHVRHVALWLGLINLALVGSTSLYSYLLRSAGNGWDGGAARLQSVLMYLNLGSENTFASWYSSMLLFLVAVAATVCYAVDSAAPGPRSRRGPDLGWLLLASAFALLSLDEMGAIHERIGGISTLAAGGVARGWVEVLALPIGIVGLLMIAFAYLRLRSQRAAFLLALLGTVLFLINPFLEVAEFSILGSARSVSDRWLHDLYQAVEEGAELFGSLCWLLGLLVYLRARGAPSPAGSDRPRRVVDGLRSTVLLLPAIYLLGLLVTELFVRFTLPGDTGTPRSWFPATLVLVTFACLWVRQVGRDRADPIAISALAAFALFCSALCVSAGFGLDLPGYLEGRAAGLALRSLQLCVATHVALVIWLARMDRQMPGWFYVPVGVVCVAAVFAVDASMIAIPAAAGYAVALLALTSARVRSRPAPAGRPA